jgi:hypothetical protein
MAGAQPATRRLLTEATAAATYATTASVSGAATTAANTAVASATAGLPRGVVFTSRSATPAGVTLTAGRLYRITAQTSPTTNASVSAVAQVRGVAGSTAPAAGAGAPVTPATFSAQTGTGTSTPTLLPTGVFAVGTTGAFSFALNVSPAGGSASTLVTAGAAEWVLEDIGATGAAGPGRAPAVSL